MRRESKWVAAAVLLAVVMAVPATSRAGFVIDFVGTTDEAGGTRYTYDVELADDAVVDPNDGIADFFTLYDVFGFVAGSLTRTGRLLDFVVTRPIFGKTAVNTTPEDDHTRNLSFAYNGTARLDGGENNMETFLGTFSFLSVGSVKGFEFFTGQATSDSSGRPLSTISEEEAPGPTNPGGGPIVPEPGTLSLLALGGLGLAGGAIRRRKAAKAE